MNAVRILFLGEAAGAVAAAKETDAAIAGVGRTSAVTNAEAGKLERGILAGSGAFRGLGRSIGLASAAFIGAAGITEAIKGAIGESEKLKKAQDSLRTAIEHTGGDVDKLEPRYTAIAKAAAQYGVTQSDATIGLARATLLTGSAEKAQRAYQEALVISKGDQVPFTSALTATSKAQEGITTSLQRYGIEVKKGMSGQDQFTAVMSRWAGQAKSNTSNLDRLGTNAVNLGGALGGPLLSGLNLVAGALSAVLGWVQQNKAILAPFAAVIGITAAALGIFVGVTEGIPALLGLVSTSIDVLSVSLYGLPLTWIVLAIAAVVVGLVELWKHSETFRDIVIGTWHAVRAAAEAVFGAIARVVVAAWDHIRGATTAVLNFLREHWRAAVVALAAILLGPLGAIVALIVTHWGRIRTITVSVWNAVRNGVTAAVHGVRSAVSSVFGALGGIVRGAAADVRAGASAIRSAFSPVLSVLQQIIHLAETAFGWLDKIAHKAGGVLSHIPGGGVLSHIPGFAGGVTNFTGGYAMVGEYGPELVNLPRGSEVLTAAQTRRMAGSGSGGVGSSTTTVVHKFFPNAHFHVLGSTDRMVAQALSRIVASAPDDPRITVVAK